MSVKKLSELTYKEQKIKIGNCIVNANNKVSVVEENNDSFIQMPANKVSKPEVDVQQLKVLYAKELEAIELEARTKAEKEGYNKGILKAKEDANNAYKEKQTELQKQLESLKEIEKTLLSKQKKTLKSEQGILLEVIYTIISKLVQNPDFYQEFIKKIITDISFKNKEQSISISLHPDDVKLIGKLNLNEQLANLKIYEDKSIKHGGVFIESDDRTVDARLETILINTKKILLTRNND